MHIVVKRSGLTAVQTPGVCERIAAEHRNVAIARADIPPTQANFVEVLWLQHGRKQNQPRIRKVLAQCMAEVVEGPSVAEGSRWLPVAEEMAIRYIGPDGAEQLAPSHGWERYLVKLTPRDGKITTWQGADWARRYFDPGQRPDLDAAASAPPFR